MHEDRAFKLGRNMLCHKYDVGLLYNDFVVSVVGAFKALKLHVLN